MTNASSLLRWSICLLVFTGCQTDTDPTTNLTSQMDSIAYAVGMDIGKFYHTKQGIELDPEHVYQGFRDIVSDSLSLRMTEAEGAALITRFANMMEAKLAATNEINQQGFLDQNRIREGVMERPSGIQYEVLQEGAGSSPTLDNIVRISFTGQLLDGTIFATSANEPEQSLEIDISQTVAGLQEALTHMKPGDQWKVWIPAELGYGSENRPPIGPNSLLVYTIELQEIMR